VVLESYGQDGIGSRVIDRGAHVGVDHDLSVDWHDAGLAAAHANTLKDILSVLMLVKEEVVGSLLH
jgi:hypothetical protein